MKKLIAVLIVLICLLYVFNINKQFTLLDYFKGEYLAYTSNMIDENSFDLGFCYMNSKTLRDGVVGESVKVNNLEVASAIKTLNAKVVNNEQLEDGTLVIYAYSKLIPNKVVLNDENVNLQIAIKDDCCVIGWPLILGAY